MFLYKTHGLMTHIISMIFPMPALIGSWGLLGHMTVLPMLPLLLTLPSSGVMAPLLSGSPFNAPIASQSLSYLYNLHRNAFLNIFLGGTSFIRGLLFMIGRLSLISHGEIKFLTCTKYKKVKNAGHPVRCWTLDMSVRTNKLKFANIS